MSIWKALWRLASIAIGLNLMINYDGWTKWFGAFVFIVVLIVFLFEIAFAYMEGENQP